MKLSQFLFESLRMLTALTTFRGMGFHSWATRYMVVTCLPSTHYFHDSFAAPLSLYWKAVINQPLFMSILSQLYKYH